MENKMYDCVKLTKKEIKNNYLKNFEKAYCEFNDWVISYDTLSDYSKDILDSECFVEKLADKAIDIAEKYTDDKIGSQIMYYSILKTYHMERSRRLSKGRYQNLLIRFILSDIFQIGLMLTSIYRTGKLMICGVRGFILYLTALPFVTSIIVMLIKKIEKIEDKAHAMSAMAESCSCQRAINEIYFKIK